MARIARANPRIKTPWFPKRPNCGHPHFQYMTLMFDMMQQMAKNTNGIPTANSSTIPDLHQGIPFQPWLDNGANWKSGGLQSVSVNYPGRGTGDGIRRGWGLGHGRGLTQNSTSTSIRTQIVRNDTPAFPKGTDECTFIFRFCMEDIQGSLNTGVWGNNSTGADACGLLGPRYQSPSDQIRFDWGGTSNGTTSLQISPSPALVDGLAIGPKQMHGHIYTCTKGKRGMEIWIDHTLWGRNDANPPRTASNETVYFHRYSGAEGTDGVILWWRAYKKQLSKGMIHSIVNDEYAPWRVYI